MRLAPVLIVSMIICGCSLTTTSRSNRAKDRAILEALQREWAEGYIALDTGRVGALLAEDYFVIHPETRGRVADRSMAMRAILRHDPNRPIYAYDQQQMEIRFYGPVALVTALSDLRTRNKTTGEDGVLRSRYLHVWVKRDGKWKLVSRQATPLPPES